MGKLFAAFLFLCVASAAIAADKKMIIVGDSLTEGLGVSKEAAYPALLEGLLHEGKLPWEVVNSGISASTSASAPSRISWALKAKPDLILLALGANDGLRALSTKEMKANLKNAIAKAKANHVQVMLLGMRMPPNYGKEYTKSFEQVYRDLAKEESVQLLPFLLADVAGHPDLNQGDGIHPNENGHRIIAKTLYNFLKDKL